MRAATQEFETYLETTNEFAIADLYTFTLKNGTVIRMTSWDTDVTIPGVGVFLSTRGNVNRSRVKQSVGLDVDELSITLQAKLEHVVMGMPILHALAQGWFRGASVLVERLYMAAEQET